MSLKRTLRARLRGVRRLRRWLRRTLGRLARPDDYARVLKRLAALEGNFAHLSSLLYEESAADPEPRARLARRELRVFSQNGEDGVLLHLFSAIGARHRRFVEFGIGSVEKCNSTNLALHFGWSGLLLDCRAEYVERARRFYAERGVPESRVRVVQAALTAENASRILAEHGVERELDLLSIDIDSNDYWIWKALCELAPRAVVIEYNASLGPDEVLIARYDPQFDPARLHPDGWYHGASLAALERLGRAKGYVLVGCESAGFNAFFVRRELAEGKLPALRSKEAWYPHSRRSRELSPAEQLASLRTLEFARDPDLD